MTTKPRGRLLRGVGSRGRRLCLFQRQNHYFPLKHHGFALAHALLLVRLVEYFQVVGGSVVLRELDFLSEVGVD